MSFLTQLTAMGFEEIEPSSEYRFTVHKENLVINYDGHKLWVHDMKMEDWKDGPYRTLYDLFDDLRQYPDLNEIMERVRNEEN